MISFTCGGCGKQFTVPDRFAGRRARCKACGTPVEIPAAANTTAAPQITVTVAPTGTTHSVATVAPAIPPPAAPRKVPMRLRRLRADAEAMATAFAHFPAIRVRPLAGDPPEAYQVDYHVRGLERGGTGDAGDGADAEPVVREHHTVEIQLTSEYPRTAPICKMLTPVFHPNIDPPTVCVGDHWTAGERLVDLVVRIGEMIAYQAYNIQSPLDAEAAMWADLHPDRLPVDNRNLHPGDAE